MLQIPWHIILWISLGIIIVFALSALLFNRQGTFTTPDSLINEDQYGTLSHRVDDKYESRGENILRACLENIFSKHFPNVRMASIVNPHTGRRLELDCYNDTLKLAAEYHGVTHYKHVPHFHKTYDEFLAAQQRDEYKKKRCAELGIELLIVPYNVPPHQICNYVKRELNKRSLLTHLTGWDDS